MAFFKVLNNNFLSSTFPSRAMKKFILLLIHLTILIATGDGKTATQKCNDKFKTKLPSPKPAEDRDLKEFATQRSKNIAQGDIDIDCSKKEPIVINLKGKETHWVCKDETNTGGRVEGVCQNFIKSLRKRKPLKINPREFRKYGCAVYDNGGNAAIVCAFQDRRDG